MTARLAGSTNGASVKTYVDDVFSAYTYTGNGSAQTITNGVDLAGKGGLVWIKNRDAALNHTFFDTTRNGSLSSNSTDAQAGTYIPTYCGFNNNGFYVDTGGQYNGAGNRIISWTFRKAAKFFDVVTWTGDGTNNRVLSHSLGIQPGMVIVKRATGGTENWPVWHRSVSAASAGNLFLNLTNALGGAKIHDADATTFTLSTSDTSHNAVGSTYVAYLFAHDTGTDGLIQCGVFSGNVDVNLGWEPQFLTVKNYGGADSWVMSDSSRGLGANGNADGKLYCNGSGVEGVGSTAKITATGFTPTGFAGLNCIYLAIRRPNKPPTVGTQVYNAIARTGTGAAATVTGAGFAPDLVAIKSRSNVGSNNWTDRLRGAVNWLNPDLTNAETASADKITALTMDGFTLGSAADIQQNATSRTYINHFFKRAPGVFDIVCYTGTGGATTIAHSLGAVPELMIVKGRSLGGYNWGVWHTDFGTTDYIILDSASAKNGFNLFNTVPTSSVFGLGSDASINGNTNTYVWYGFATKAGISKVGSYTGTGTTNAIDCGFTTGARFILIKRTDSTGGWYVWDTVRGIIAGNDPYLLLNSIAAEVTSTDYIDPSTAGFELSSTAPAAINANGGTFIYLAFA